MKVDDQFFDFALSLDSSQSLFHAPNRSDGDLMALLGLDSSDDDEQLGFFENFDFPPYEEMELSPPTTTRQFHMDATEKAGSTFSTTCLLSPVPKIPQVANRLASKPMAYGMPLDQTSMKRVASASSMIAPSRLKRVDSLTAIAA
mmetsp:Transcript_18065/g.25731  ORF Transcript_18065/g.25731 Transcript_18065/m.25731 type:complete len:145 (+) Transcript_18065:411-845(+)|eukprot:CAMPEP_0172433880 /NCGR_PEP_ID=MMETSP1064-20121228/70026_1 /TAXON_ID=202472 /ORGANISM="Aulacoseira subarctica , Strain CCAP 1002/5" /LENGTH=144 /DNA_ID=CAMNT_0013182027 /DNA_START=410 /DNA_END=844 /DNA_ORIENTATION=-